MPVGDLRIFINYRRDDSPGSAGRLHDRLAQDLPAGKLFMDVDAIAPGVDFVKEIDDKVKACDVMLAIIGRGWLMAADKEGRRRLDDPGDFVRLEIAMALKHDVNVIPILVDGAKIPAADDLPEDLRALARRNAVELSHQRFAAEVKGLA
ncbi:MAG: toll/interleukin-1 receptor domain-containing protein, partial [Rhodospirillales bacterium]